MALDIKRGDRILVQAVNDKGDALKRSWFVATVIGIARDGSSYRVRYDDGGVERVPAKEVYGRTPVKAKRKTAIHGDDLRKWRPEVEQYRRRIPQKRPKPGLTAKQMVAATPRAMKLNAAWVSVAQRRVLRRKERGPGGEEYWTQVSRTKTTAATPGGRPRIHEQRIDILDPGVKDPRKAGTRLKFRCDCEFYLYNSEVALHKYGAADIYYSNGEPPLVTNPGMTPLVCKHGIVLLS